MKANDGSIMTAIIDIVGVGAFKMSTGVDLSLQSSSIKCLLVAARFKSGLKTSLRTLLTVDEKFVCASGGSAFSRGRVMSCLRAHCFLE